MPRPAAGTPAVVSSMGPNNYYVLRVLSATPGGLDLLGVDERVGLNEQARTARASQELQAYLEHLRQDAKVTMFESALQ